MLKLIATDLDDTLLKEDKTIDERTLKALRAAEAKGVTLAVSTGRSYRSASKFAKMISENCKVSCYNGALVKDGETEIFSKFIPVPMVRKLIDFAEEENLFIQIYEDHRILFDQRVKPIWVDSDIAYIGKKVVENFNNYAFEPSPKALIVLEPERREAMMEKLKALYGDVLHITHSQDFLIEIMMKGIDKGEGLSLLCSHLGIAREEVMACGDNGNDVEMIRWAGCGVAVANAVDTAKSAADFVTESERSLGVLEAVEKFI